MSRRVGLFLIPVLFLLATNRWLPWREAHEFAQASDVTLAYEKIARASPALPDAQILIPLPQRFFFPYVLGYASKAIGVDVSVGFTLATLLVFGLILWELFRIFSRDPGGLFFFSLIVLNPYTLRYYLLVPGMLVDLICKLGILWVCRAILERRLGRAILGFFVGVLARQTMIFALPGLLFWIFFDPNILSGLSKLKRFGVAFAITLVAAVIYRWQLIMSAPVSIGSVGLDAVYGVVPWIFSDRFSLRELTEHFLRLLSPMLSLVVAGSMLAIGRVKDWKISWTVLSLVLVGVPILLQPFGGTPWIMAANVSRLAAFGVLPLFVALWVWLREQNFELPSGNKIFALLALPLALGSLHHVYSSVGPSSLAQYYVYQAVALSLLAASLRLLPKKV